MKTSAAAVLALSLFAAGSASAMVHKSDVVDAVNSANSYGTVVVHLDGTTATLTGSVGSILEAKIIANAAERTDGVSRVINMISFN